MLEVVNNLLLFHKHLILQGNSYLAQPHLVGLHAVSSSLIAIALYLISAWLFYCLSLPLFKGEPMAGFPFRRMFRLLGVFFIGCATVHIMTIWTLWHPSYWVFALIKMMTAIVSVYTAWELVALIPQLHELANVSHLEPKERTLDTLLREQRFRNYFTLPLLGIGIISPDKGWLEVNDKLCEILGYCREQLREMTWAEITHPDDLQVDIEQFNRVLAGESDGYSMDKRFIRFDGVEICANISTRCVRHTAEEERGREPWQSKGSVDYLVMVVQDITDRVQVEKRLRLLESVVVNSNDAVLITEAEPIDEPGPKILYANDAFTRMTGYTQEEVLGKNPRILQGPKSDRAQLAKLRVALEKWQPVVVELINYRKDGSEFWVEISIVPVADPTGWYTHWIAVQRDITERKLAEQERIEFLQDQVQRVQIEAREQLYHTLAEAIPQLVWSAQADGRFDYVNQRWLDYTSLTLEQSQGWGWQSVLHPDDLEQCFDRWNKALKGEENYEVEVRFNRGSDGYYCWHLVRALPVRDRTGKIVKWFGTCTDIDHRKRGEEAQRFLSEASNILATSLDYETTLSSLARLTVPKLADWCAVHVVENNQSIRRVALAHVDPDKVAWGNELDRKYPMDFNEPRGVAQVIRTGQSEFYPDIPEALLVAAARDPEHLEILRAVGFKSVIIVALKAGGQTLGTISLVLSESERRYSSEDMDLALELAHRAALAVDNARAHREVQEANRMKDDFLAIVSHELRTPLNAMLGWAQLLKGGKLSADKRGTAVETIERNARSQKQLIEDLLDVSRLIRDQLLLKFLPIDLVPLIEAAVNGALPAAQAKGIEIQCVFASQLGTVSGDSVRLQQVIWNLLANAIKFTPSGGRVEVKVLMVKEDALSRIGNGVEKLSNTHYPLSLTHYAQIRVSDTGVGIQADFLPFVFDRFRQGDSTATRSYGGLGLGLAIVRHLVELHGGTVQAESPGKGKGATFIVQIPLIQARGKRLVVAPKEEAEFCLVPRAPSLSPLSGLRVLVVDDEADARELVTTLLQQYGADAIAVVNACQAISEIERSSPDVLVSDIGMPVEDGYALLRQVRALEAERGGHIPAVALTAYARESDRTKALEAGFQVHMPKPIDPDRLVALVAKLTGRSGFGSP